MNECGVKVREKAREAHVSERCTALHRLPASTPSTISAKRLESRVRTAVPPPLPHYAPTSSTATAAPSPPLLYQSNSPSPTPSQTIPTMASPSPSPPPPSSSAAVAPPRRLPPPCWTDDEAAAVAEAFRDKWLAIGRGNLRAHDWQEVADAVAARCGTAKTPVQCRHKVEKLRKRYRNEKRRLVSLARPRQSSWGLFYTFDAMESGGSAAAAAVGRPVVTVARPPPPPSTTPSISPSSDDGESEERSHLYANGYDARLVMPRMMQIDTFPPKSATGRHPIPLKKKRRLAEDADPMSEVVWAIQQLGEMFMRVEQMKMEMAREVEKIRMETETQRMKMMETLLYPYHGIAGGKRQKKMPTSLR